MSPLVQRLSAPVACLALAVATTATAQTFPTKPVRLIVPFPPGDAVDVCARTIQPALAESLGQPIIIENKTGASGMIGTEAVAKSAPDGYTLVVGNIATFAMNVGIYMAMPYDPLRDLTPILHTVKEKLAAAGLLSAGGTPDEFSRYIKSEIAKWSKVARDIGVTVD